MFSGVTRPPGVRCSTLEQGPQEHPQACQRQGACKPTRNPQETHKDIYSSFVTPPIPAVCLLSRPFGNSIRNAMSSKNNI